MKQGRVILADTHVNVLGAIRSLLETEAETVLMVADESSLWDALENFKPDVVVIDLPLLFAGGTNAAPTLKKKFPEIKMIVLSRYDENFVLNAVQAAGVEGLVLKSRAVIDLIPALCEIRQGRPFVSQGIRGEE
ncbi:MAG: response regulator transcription factor [Deltaproteobacteria bacterium]|nr:response regulator transcription factor [Deltaproteobacteria bacterium]